MRPRFRLLYRSVRSLAWKENSPLEPIYLSTDDVAKLLNTTRENVYVLCRQGRIPFVKQGRRTLIPVRAWEQFVAAQTQAAMAGMRANCPAISG